MIKILNIKNKKAKINLKFPSHRRGFTLIELLVVIAVISMITALLFPNFMGIRQRSRDAKRKSDLSQIQKALELYKMDQSSPVYPTSLASCGECWSSGANCTENIYIRKFPCDPLAAAPTYIYAPTGSFSYALTACLENLVDSDRDPTPAAACSTSAVSYTINEP